MPEARWRLEAVLIILTLRLAQLSEKHPSPAISATAAKFGALRSSVPTEALEPGPGSLTGSEATPVNGDQDIAYNPSPWAWAAAPELALPTEIGSLPSSSTASSIASGPDSSTKSSETPAEDTQDAAIATVEQGDNENRYSCDSCCAPAFWRFIDPTNNLPAPVQLASIDLTCVQVAPDQSATIQSATDPSIRAMSTDPSGGGVLLLVLRALQALRQDRSAHQRSSRKTKKALLFLQIQISGHEFSPRRLRWNLGF